MLGIDQIMTYMKQAVHWIVSGDDSWLTVELDLENEFSRSHGSSLPSVVAIQTYSATHHSQWSKGNRAGKTMILRSTCTL